MMKKFGRPALVLALAASTTLVAACATETAYRPATGSGFYRTGYSDVRIEPNRYRVTFAGNIVTDRDVVERYLLFRAAELTLQQGFALQVVGNNHRAQQNCHTGTLCRLRRTSAVQLVQRHRLVCAATRQPQKASEHENKRKAWSSHHPIQVAATRRTTM